MAVLDVNGHLHTPYSFSAFTGVTQALDMAAEEGVKVVTTGAGNPEKYME